MKFILSIVICVVQLGFLHAQLHVQDTISGGSYTITANAMIDSLVQKTTRAKCYKPTETIIKPAKENENFDPCANSQKVMGYKIQIMYTKDRNTASRTRAEFARSFPNLVPEMVYTQPDYRVMAGDYFTKRSAAMDLNAVKRKYPGAFLVQWRVWCRKAK
ncbi:MAG: SPOR domain-containing protein [Weeksellaceae bacterium]